MRIGETGKPSGGAAIAGVVLAAGRSSRMGRPKPLLRTGNDTFIERAIGVLLRGGCESVIAVVNVSDATVPSLAAKAGARIVRNPDPAAEQLESVRLAIDALPAPAEAILVLPVDVPLVAESTVAAVLSAFRERRAPIVLPAYRGVTGHPILLASDVFAELRGGALPEGMRSLIERHAADLIEVPVDDPGILVDVDTPEQYELVREREREGERQREGTN